MRAVFADAAYFIALLNPADNFHACALELARRPPGPLITTYWLILVTCNRDDFLALVKDHPNPGFLAFARETASCISSWLKASAETADNGRSAALLCPRRWGGFRHPGTVCSNPMKTLSIIFLAACLGFAADAIRAATPASGVRDATVTVPANLMDDARHAKDAFDQGRYMDCQKIYERMLNQAPDNVYILSNLGVVYFRNMKWKLAEDSLKRATAVNPKDVFSYLTLGIIYYQEKRYDDALRSVHLALAINPKYKEAVNYKWLIEQTSQSIAIPPTLPFPNASPLPTIPPGDYPTEHELELQRGTQAARASLR